MIVSRKPTLPLILCRSVIEHVLLLSGLAPHLSGDLLPQRSWSTMPFNSRENSTGGFLLSQQCAMDYRMSDCQQKDMQDLPAPVVSWLLLVPT